MNRTRVECKVTNYNSPDTKAMSLLDSANLSLVYGLIQSSINKSGTVQLHSPVLCIHCTLPTYPESGFCDYTNDVTLFGTYVWPETEVNPAPVTLNCTYNRVLYQNGTNCLKQSESPDAVATRICSGVRLWDLAVGPGCITTVTFNFRTVGDPDCGAVSEEAASC